MAASEAARRIVFRTTGRRSLEAGSTTVVCTHVFQQSGPEARRSTVRRVPDVAAAENRLGEAADREDLSAAGERGQERAGLGDLSASRRTVRGRPARAVRVSRDDVPEEDVILEPELAEDAVHDGGGRLGRTRAGELAFRRQRDAAHTGSAVAGCLGDEEERGVDALLQVGGEPLAQKRSARPVTVEVECRPDPCLGKRVDHGTSLGRVIRRRVVVHGYVQGVFFRDSTRRLAERHGVAGWARNNRDGTVEAVFEGEPEAVERLVAFMSEGPRGAEVARVETSEEDPEGLTSFGVS
jgi:acylphosphatase